MESIFNKFDTDKNSRFHNYTRQYEALFKEWAVKPISFLEIGVLGGQSIKAWREFFPNAIKIVGIDINSDCKQYEDIKNNIYVEIGDATNKDFLNYIMKKHGSFDIVLDDGSHYNSHVIQTFEYMFPMLNNSGLYIVEDTICYKMQGYIDRNYPNHLDYFIKFIPFLNQRRYDDSTGDIRDNCVDPFKIIKKTTNIFEQSIDKIEFGCSYIAINKVNRLHWV